MSRKNKHSRNKFSREPKSKKKSKNNSTYSNHMGIIVVKNEKKKKPKISKSEDIFRISDEIFGSRYYCIGDS